MFNRTSRSLWSRILGRKDRSKAKQQQRRRSFFESLEQRSLLATVSYAVPTGTAGNQNFGGSLGMDFDVTAPITVTNLGAFDSNSDGISGTINVRLYDRTAPGAPLVSANFTGVAQQLFGGSRFASIAALNLPIGFQGRIVADGYSGAELNGNSVAPVWTTNSGGSLNFVGGGFFDGAAGVYPNGVDGGPANRYAAGTFAFVPQALTTVYADDSWALFAPGQLILDADPGTAGNQNAVFGADAFATISGAVTAAAATGTVIVSAGTYPEAVTLSGTKTLEISGPAEAVTLNALTTAAGQNVTLEGTAILTVGDATSTTIAGIISGSGSLTKAGAGTLTLTGGNTYTGATTVNLGMLSINQVGPGSNNANIGAGANTQLTTSTLNVAAGAVANLNTGSNFSSANTGTTLTGAGTIRLSSGVWWLGNAGGGTTISMSAGGLIDIVAGTMKNDYASANWSANLSSLNVAGGAFFNLRNNNVSIASLTGAGTVFNDFATNTLTIGVANGTGGTFTGTIGPGGTSLNLTKVGIGTQTLSGANTYTGVTSFNAGILRAATIADYGVPSSLGARIAAQETNVGDGIGLVFRGGTLQYTGATAQSTNRQIRIQTTGGTIDASGTVPAATLSFTYSAANTNLFDTPGTRTLNLTGTNTGANTFGIQLIDQGANATSLTKTGAGLWSLTNGGSTYTGVTSFTAGILRADTISNYGVPSSLGARLAAQETAAGDGIGFVFRGGTLQYAGAVAQSTNRQIRMQNNTTNTIDASGTVPTATLSFTYSAANTNLFDTPGTRTLNLTGTNTGANTFAIQLTDQAGNATSLTKAGIGTWTLTGTNTYTGTTSVNAGVLQLQNGAAISNTAGAVSVALGATLQLLTSETISSYVGAGDIGVGTNDSLLALGANTLTTTGAAAIANVTTAAGGGIIAGTSITDTDDDNNITGPNVYLQAATGIGTAGDPIETAVSNIQLNNSTSGMVHVVNSNAGALLTVSDLRTLGFGSRNLGGATTIINSSPMTIAANVISAGAIVLTAVDSAVAGDNLILNAGVLVQSTGSSVTLNAGDNATITGNVTSATTTTINVDATSGGVADVGTGGSLVITGIVTTPVVGSGGGAFLNGFTDNDTFTFNPQTTTEFRLFGDQPVSTVTGDTLVMDVTGTTNPNLTVPGSLAPYSGNGSGAWSFTSAHRPVLFGSIEQSTITGNYHLTFDNSVALIANLFVMRDAGMTNLQLRSVSNAGTVVYQGSLATILSLRVLGSSGNDTVTVDDINTLPDFAGTVPLVTDNANLAGTAEFLFDGLGGNDTLVFNINGATASQQYAIGNGTGAAGLQGEIASTAAGITLQSYFQNVELSQRTGIGATPAGLSIIGDSSENVFTTQANGGLTNTSVPGYTPFEFSGNNYNALAISALAGTDTLDLVSLGSGQTNHPTIMLNGDSEDDTLRVRSTSGNTGVVALNGNAGSDLFQLFNAALTVDNIVGPVVVDGSDGNVAGNTDTLVIVDSGDLTGDNVVIAAVNPVGSQDYRIEGIVNPLAPNDVIFRNIDVLNYTGTAGNDTIDSQFVNTTPAHDLNTVVLSGWLGADQFLLFTSDQIGGTAPTPSGTASGVATIQLYGDAVGNPNVLDGNDTFGTTPAGVVGTGAANVGLVVPDSTRMIRPSASTAIAIDGGQPTGLAAPLGDVIGDVLNVDISALPNTTPVVVSTFSPGTVVAVGIQPLTWTQIEDINLVDQGKLTNVQMGDLFARTTPAADLVQITRNPTTLNPNQVRLRINATIANYSASNKTIIYAGGANDTITQSNLTIPAEFYGEAGDDYLSGAMNNDWLVGGIGNDRINGSGGDNIIWGDNAPTNPGDLTPQDGAVGGNDTLSGLGGNDVFYAGAGDDSVSAGAGNDYVNGGQGNDTLGGDDGDDRVYGGAGNDILSGHSGNDLLSGADGDDKLYGATGNDVLFGGNGIDLIDGGDGNDLLVSGSVANENSSFTSLANTTTFNAATYTNPADNDAALRALLIQWGNSGSNRAGIGAITHDLVNDDLFGGTGDDDFCWETPDVTDNPPGIAPPDFNAPGMGTDERFGPM